MAQVVTALDAATALATDEAARRAGTKCYYPKQRRVEDCVDREARPDGAERECAVSRFVDSEKMQIRR